MGLDMYLYCGKKSVKDEIDRIRVDISKKDEEHSDFYASLPVRDCGWGIDKDKLDEETKKKLDSIQSEFNDLWDERAECFKKLESHKGEFCGGEYAYWRKFNALHGFICNRFAGGVDECQEIPLSTENLAFILDCIEKDISYLKGKTLVKRSNGGEDEEIVFNGSLPKTDSWDYEFVGVDKDNLNLVPTGGFFFGSYEISSWYLSHLLNSKEVFSKLLKFMEKNPDHVVWYQASW